MKQLREDDARALDMILEHGLDAAHGETTSADPETVKRVGVVESVLRVFGELPAEEPSNDLVARTLAYVYAGAPGAMPDTGTSING